MTPNVETLRIITGWLTSLAEATAHRERKPGKDAIALYASILGQSFPSGAFTAESLAHVTSTEQWWPAVGALTPLIGAWWNDHKPRSAPAIGHERPEGWTDMEEGWVRYWHTRNREIALLDDPRRADFERGRVASLIRTHSPRAWERISGEKQSFGKAPSQAEVDAVARHAAMARMPVQPPPAPRQRFAQPVVADVTLTGDTLVAVRAAAKRSVGAP